MHVWQCLPDDAAAELPDVIATAPPVSPFGSVAPPAVMTIEPPDPVSVAPTVIDTDPEAGRYQCTHGIVTTST